MDPADPLGTKKGVDDGRTADGRNRYDLLCRAVARYRSHQAVAVGAGMDSADREQLMGCVQDERLVPFGSSGSLLNQAPTCGIMGALAEVHLYRACPSLNRATLETNRRSPAGG